MVGQRTALLNKASQSFTDKNKPCVCYGASSVNGWNGFNYILIDKTKSKIINNIAIHTNRNRDMTISGQMDFGEYIFQTPVSLSDMFKENPDLYILNYDNKFFMVHSLIAYNNEMKHYDYRAEILQNKNKNFIIYDTTEIVSNLLNNSIPLWLQNSERLNIAVYPSYLSPLNLETAYLSVEITDTKPFSMTRLRKENGDTVIGQWKQDTVRLHLINQTTELQQELAYNIQTLSMNYKDNVFGINDIINFKSVQDDRQKGFGIITNKVISDFKINYFQETITRNIAMHFIKELIVKVNENTITLFNLNEIEI